MYLIKYVGGAVGCPHGNVYGNLLGYDWNSNDYSDPRFPQEGTVLEFFTEYESFDADFFYFGSEFICSREFSEVVRSFNYGEADFVPLTIFVRKNGKYIGLDKKYCLVRSREIRKLLDLSNSSFELRTDPRTGKFEQDIYHAGRDIYDVISSFKLKDKYCDLDFFVCSELLIGEYVFSAALKKAIDAKHFKGFLFSNIEDLSYDARLEF